MNQAEMLALAGGAGVVLGAVFVVGLWWTVRWALASKHVALWFLGSQVLRTGVVLAGFYFVSAGHWDRLLACLLGFVVARSLVTRLSGPPIGAGDASSTEAGRAP